MKENLENQVKQLCFFSHFNGFFRAAYFARPALNAFLWFFYNSLSLFEHKHSDGTALNAVFASVAFFVVNPGSFSQETTSFFGLNNPFFCQKPPGFCVWQFLKNSYWAKPYLFLCFFVLSISFAFLFSIVCFFLPLP